MMKKYFAHTLVLLFILSLSVGPNYAKAQATPPAKNLPPCSATDINAGLSGIKCDGTKPVGSTGDTSSGCGLIDMVNPLQWIPCAAAAVANIILKIASLITGLAGAILNYVVYFTVVQMSENYGKIKAINSAWMVVRDIANMGFIFVLLYASIQLILGIGKDTRKLIVNMVIAALLINFSLFFTKIAIDASNLLALTFYHAIAPDSAANGNLMSTGISNAMMKPLGLTSIWKSAGTLGATNLITIGVMGTIVSLIAAFVFIAVALMFVIRYVILIMVLILSPIAFVSSVIPGLSKYKDQWVKALTGQAVFAPVYFLLTWIVISVFQNTFSVTDLGAALTGTMTTANGADSVGVGTIPMLFNFVVVIAFLITSLIISKSVSDSSGNGVGKLTSWATGVAGGATLGMAGRFGRGTIGRAGQALADNEKLKEAAPNSRLARLALSAGSKSAGASFDVRGGILGGSLGAGKARSGGFAKDMKDKIDAQKKYADNAFKPSDLTVDEAETELKEAKKTDDKTRINDAQARVDSLKGADENELRNRKARGLRFDDPTLDEKASKKKVKELEDQYFKEVATLVNGGMNEDDAKKAVDENITNGTSTAWAPKEVKSAVNRRKEEYAKGIAAQQTSIGIPFTDIKTPKFNADITGRHFIFGPVKKEYKAQALAIRKSVKEKSKKDKLAEAAEAIAQENADNSTTPATPSASTPGTPPASGGTQTTP